MPRARTCCGQTLSAVCMAGGAGTDNGPEAGSRLVLGLHIIRCSSSSSSRPTTSPCKVRLPCARRPPALCEPSRSARVLARAPTVPRAGVAGASGEVAVRRGRGGSGLAPAARAASHIHERSHTLQAPGAPAVALRVARVSEDVALARKLRCGARSAAATRCVNFACCVAMRCLWPVGRCGVSCVTARWR